uniref:Uncharacterized protein n=1 Tax=Branchiostoma floridae TaxID=7739 RepID=C3ZUS1_BRAFL|eukprot:XP_002587772.1 hypothetical protein BRAFLDRAFT_94675 [Branchiostoma floridae]
MSHRSVRDVLRKLLQLPKNRGYGDEISVRFSGDGRQVTQSNRIGAVMSTVRIVPNRNTIDGTLDSAQLHHSIDEEAAVFLYEGGEDYETQKKTAALVYQELEDIAKNGLLVGDHLIEVNLYAKLKEQDHLQKAMKDIGVPFRLMEGTGDDGKGSIKTWSQLNVMSHRSVRDVLRKLLQLPKNRGYGDEISVRISGDGRQVTQSNRIGAVMSTVRIVPNRNTIDGTLDSAQLHHTIDEEAAVFLYEGDFFSQTFMSYMKTLILPTCC